MRILLTGDGSGGHTFPLIAVARKLIEISRTGETFSLELLFVGSDNLSKSIFKAEGIQTRTIFAGKMRRYISLLSIIDILKLPLGLIQVYWHMLYFMPDIIFAKGGYGSIPAVLVGWLFRIPIFIHDSDIVPGIANTFIARFSTRIAVSFESTASFFPKNKTIVTGNPIRRELFSKIPGNAREMLNIQSERPIIFVIGGSQGAKQINDLMLLALPDFIKHYEIIHQTGKRDYEMMKRGAFIEIKDKRVRALYHPYAMLTEEEMASAYFLASIVVSRAGSGAIFEIAASGKPSILIPYMAAAGSHQLKNAQAYKEIGAARVLSGSNITPHMLISLMDSIINDPEIIREMSEAALRFAKPDAAAKIVDEILKIIE